MAFLEEPKPQPIFRVPAAAIGLIVVLVAAHLALVWSPQIVSQAVIANYAFIPARYSHAFLAAHSAAPQSLWDEAVPFVSYIFLHANFTHLAMNCIWALPFAAITARRFGAIEFFVLFLLCGIAGAVAHLLTHWGSENYVVGASAAIAGLMAVGFRIVAAADSPEALAYAVSGAGRGRAPLAPIFSSRMLIWSFIWIAINVIAGKTGLGTGMQAEPVAWQAHIGGYVAGLALAGPFDALRGRLLPRLTTP